MADQADLNRIAGSPDTTKVFISASLSAISYVVVGFLSICGLVIRLYVASVEGDIQSLRTALSAEETARVQNSVRLATLERSMDRHGEQHVNQEKAFDNIFKRVERLEEERWQRKR